MSQFWTDLLLLYIMFQSIFPQHLMYATILWLRLKAGPYIQLQKGILGLELSRCKCSKYLKIVKLPFSLLLGFLVHGSIYNTVPCFSLCSGHCRI